MLRPVARALLELVYPPRCAACREPARVEPFCPICAEAIDPVPPGCVRCGAPGPDPLCGACLAAPPAFDAVLAGGLFGGPLADAVHALKYGTAPRWRGRSGRGSRRGSSLPPGAAVVSVPLGRARRIARGYDQAAPARRRGWRGRRRSRRAARAARSAGSARRRRRSGATRAERAGTWPARSRPPRRWRAKDLVLVDDVVTTGATADAAAQALRRAGARSVGVRRAGAGGVTREKGGGRAEAHRAAVRLGR